jgi:hypothetical protein
MRAIGKLLLLVAFGVIATKANGEPTQYLCTVEQSAGLHFDKQIGKWRPREFGARKYVLRRLTDEDRNQQTAKWRPLIADNPQADWAFFEYGKTDAMPLSICVEPEKDAILSRDFNCHSIVQTARFDKETRRFEMTVGSGYIHQGFWEQLRRERPDYFATLLAKGQATDPSKPDDLFVEIGTCSPS